MSDINIWTGLLLLFISYLYIAAKASQQLAVVNFHFKWVIPTSLLLAFCEVTTITTLVVYKSLWYFPFIGVGAGLGAITTMYFYKRNRDKKLTPAK